MAKFKTRITTFICNVLICILSLASVGSYFVLPLWKIDASYHIEEQTLEKMLADMLKENAGENEELKNVDVTEIVDEEGLTIPLSLSLETQDVLSAIGENGPQMAQKIIDDTVNTVVDQFSETLNKMAKALTKSVTKNALESAMNEQIYSVFSDEKTAEEVENMMSDAGITEEYITEKTDELVEAIFTENATVSGVSENVTTIVEEVFDKLATSGNEEFKDIELSEDDKAKIESTVSDVLSYIANEDGTIDIDGLIANGLLSILGSSESESEQSPSEESGENAVKGMSASFEDQTGSMEESITSSDNASDSSQDATQNATEEEKDAQEELKAMLREKVMELLPDNITQSIANVLKIVGYILLFTFFTWLYLIFKFLIKLTALNNSIRLKLPISLGWIPFLVLYVLPTGVFTLVKNPPTFLQNALGADAIKSLSDITNGLTITFSSGAWVSFAVAVFLVLFNAFFYRKLSKRLKAVTKGEIAKVDESVEEKASAKNKDLPQQTEEKTPLPKNKDKDKVIEESTEDDITQTKEDKENVENIQENVDEETTNVDADTDSDKETSKTAEETTTETDADNIIDVEDEE